jgi:hypothetical protein
LIISLFIFIFIALTLADYWLPLLILRLMIIFSLAEIAIIAITTLAPLNSH